MSLVRNSLYRLLHPTKSISSIPLNQDTEGAKLSVVWQYFSTEDFPGKHSDCGEPDRGNFKRGRCLAAGRGLRNLLIEPGKPLTNGISESFNGKFRD